MAKILSKFGEQQLVMVIYACEFNQSETGKYFEWIIILFLCLLAFNLFLPPQLQPNVNSLAARPQLTDWLAHMCRSVTKTVVSSLNSAGDQQGIAGVWMSTARKYPALKSEGSRTAVRKVILKCSRKFLISFTNLFAAQLFSSLERLLLHLAGSS